MRWLMKLGEFVGSESLKEMHDKDFSEVMDQVGDSIETTVEEFFTGLVDLL